MGINQRIALQMMEDGKTQEQVAEEFKVTQPAVSAMLKRIKKCPHCGELITKEDLVQGGKS